MTAVNQQVEVAMKNIYKDGFNIYMMLNKLKKDLKRKDHFPDDLVLAFCGHYWKYRSAVKHTFPYFRKAFRMAASEYHANLQIQEGESHKNKEVSQIVKDLMKGMSI